jgi:5'-nucleotidase
MVVSGINSGANLGDDVIYSGTVAAAMEGRFLGYPAIAVSLASNQCLHYETAAYVVKKLIEYLMLQPLPADTILNVNVPDVPVNQLQGFAITRLGNRHRAERVVAVTDPRGRLGYWIGPPGSEQDAGAGTDFAAISAGLVSITPLQVDLTRHQAIPALTEWLQGMKG